MPRMSHKWILEAGYQQALEKLRIKTEMWNITNLIQASPIKCTVWLKQDVQKYGTVNKKQKQYIIIFCGWPGYYSIR